MQVEKRKRLSIKDHDLALVVAMKSTNIAVLFSHEVGVADFLRGIFGRGSARTRTKPIGTCCGTRLCARQFVSEGQ